MEWKYEVIEANAIDNENLLKVQFDNLLNRNAVAMEGFLLDLFTAFSAGKITSNKIVTLFKQSTMSDQQKEDFRAQFCDVLWYLGTQVRFLGRYFQSNCIFSRGLRRFKKTKSNLLI